MGEVESVQLVDDERAEYGNRNGVIDEPSAKQVADEPELDHAVDQQINGRDISRADREALRPRGDVADDGSVGAGKRVFAATADTTAVTVSLDLGGSRP
jgi:hypothetical protein